MPHPWSVQIIKLLITYNTAIPYGQRSVIKTKKIKQRYKEKRKRKANASVAYKTRTRSVYFQQILKVLGRTNSLLSFDRTQAA
jgi:tRNA(Met) C34 N-acetyltransferase TmcA